MKYLLLVHHDEHVLGSLSQQELQQMREESVLLANDINVNGNYLDAAPLQPVSTAVSLRIREGKRQVTDGPFGEANAIVGGCTIVQAKDIDEAIEIAKGCPILESNANVEVRPIQKM